jgi:hypothetical protein
LHVRTEIYDALTQRKPPPLGDQEADKGLPGTSRKLQRHVSHFRAERCVSAEQIALPEPEVANAEITRS